MTGHIFIEGEIGKDQVSVQSVRNDIAQYPHAKDWVIHINSGGGDVYEGYTIGNIIAALPNTHAQIGAACCSIATYVAESCGTITMPPQGDFMIHLPTGNVQGNSNDFRRAAEQLDRIKSELADKYMQRVAKKGVLSREDVLNKIENETSMSPQEALQFGFIDDVQEKLKAVAKIDINKLKNMETNLTREEALGMFAKFGEKLDSFFNKSKFKNSVQVALADGTMATSDAATIDALVGSILSDATGSPAAPGPYETADGYVITVSEGGKVDSYEPIMNDKDSSKENEALKQQVADLQSQLAAKSTEATQAQSQIKSIEASTKAQFKNLQEELEKLKTATFGDTEPPAKNANFQNENQKRGYDPMAELGEAYITSRPTSFNRK